MSTSPDEQPTEDTTAIQEFGIIVPSAAVDDDTWEQRWLDAVAEAGHAPVNGQAAILTVTAAQDARSPLYPGDTDRLCEVVGPVVVDLTEEPPAEQPPAEQEQAPAEQPSAEQ